MITMKIGKGELEELRAKAKAFDDKQIGADYNKAISGAINVIKSCELVEPNVKRIRLYEAIGALMELKK